MCILVQADLITYTQAHKQPLPHHAHIQTTLTEIGELLRPADTKHSRAKHHSHQFDAVAKIWSGQLQTVRKCLCDELQKTNAGFITRLNFVKQANE